EDERFKLLKLYLNKYLSDEIEAESKWGSLFKITVKDLTDDVIREVAKKTEGFSGRGITKLVGQCSSGGVWAAGLCFGLPDF
ncbi:hypothetical protein U1Q18_041483, partial [Sarracenia purpurea var. burkii]